MNSQNNSILQDFLKNYKHKRFSFYLSQAKHNLPLVFNGGNKFSSIISLSRKTVDKPISQSLSSSLYEIVFFT